MSLINIPSPPIQSLRPIHTTQNSLKPPRISLTCQLDLDDDALSAFKLGIKEPYQWPQAIALHYTETALPCKISFVLMLRHRLARLC